MSGFFLTRDEVEELCGTPMKRLQIEHLRRHGIVFWPNRQGKPVVPRAQFGTAPQAPAAATWAPKVLQGGKR